MHTFIHITTFYTLLLFFRTEAFHILTSSFIKISQTDSQIESKTKNNSSPLPNKTGKEKGEENQTLIKQEDSEMAYTTSFSDLLNYLLYYLSSEEWEIRNGVLLLLREIVHQIVFFCHKHTKIHS